jgi:hypothetical protein
MSSFFDEASLVMIPSGYKDQKVYSVKPLDGSGDLTFSRASSATRVASNGLIEKVRTNLVLQSEAFNTTWAVNGIVVTANTAANPLTGTTTADTITANAADNFHLITQSVTYAASENTVSVYVKANGYSWFVIDPNITNAFAYFNVTTGAIGTTGSASTASITSVGSGWYRCSLTFNPAAGAATLSFSIRNTDNGGNFLGDGVSGFFIFGAQVETGVATDYIATTSAAVSVGPVSGLPRLDYLNSTCPRLLLEPQRTNNLVFSEQFTTATWATDGNGAGETKTANYAISPDGYQNADRIQLNRTGGSYSRIRQDYATSGTHTGSVYLKSNTGASQKIWMRVDGGTATKITITTSWQRFIVSGSTSAALELFIDNTDAEIATIADFSAWGAQLEAGAYATSYIPTLGTSVTRVADAASKTGISSLIGQTNGTFFVDVTFGNPRNSWFFSLVSTNWTDDSFYLETFGANNYIAVNTVKSGAGAGGASSTIAATTGVRAKIAVQYTGTTMNMFINGVKYTGTRTAIANCTGLYIDELGTFGASDNQKNTNRFNQVLTFTSTLTDAQCIELTTL